MSENLHITKDNEGRRLDRVLRTLWPDVRLGEIMKAIRKGDVRVDGKKAKVDTRLEEGQLVQVPWDANKNQKALRENHKHIKNGRLRKYPALDTVYRDNYMWIVNKPAGLLTQPDKKGGDSLITRALAELNWDRTDFRPSTVQRLDRNTSGAIIIAMSGTAQRHLSELIRERRIGKLYRAVVQGESNESGTVDLPLIKDPKTNTVKVDIKNGRGSISKYRRVCCGNNNSSIEVDLITGRPHQARVHMAEIGHPLLGDRKYGNGFGAKRPLLHAYKITFPVDDKLPKAVSGHTFTAELPADMDIFF